VENFIIMSLIACTLLPYIIRMIKSKRMRWMKYVACMGEMRNARKVLVQKPEGKRSLGRPRHRWEDSTKTDPKKKGGRV
jgi:hypothetical protein